MAKITNKISLGITALLLSLLLTACSTSAPKSDKTDKQAALQGRLQLATEYLRNNNHKGARDHLQRALEIDRRSAEAHDLLALLYTKELEPVVAEKHYRNAIKFEPKFTRVRNNYGSFLYNQRRFEEAIAQFQKGADDLNYPLRYEIFGKMGLSNLKLEQREQARKNFEKAIALNQRWPQAYLELATLTYQDGDYTTSQQYFNVYSRLVKRPNARSLWLGFRLDDAFGKKNARDSKGLALKNLFSDSQENREYQEWLNNNERHKNTTN